MDPENLSLLVAFAAGLLSFLSPCVLPMVPAYVGYLAGDSAESAATSRRPTALLHSAAFVLGFSVVFVGFWASIGAIGFVVREYASLLRQVAGAVLILLGLHQAGILKIPLLYRQLRLDLRLPEKPTSPTSFLVGVAFAAGWTPCIGTVLAGIIGLATMSDTVVQGTALLVAYSAGLGVPFLLTGAAIGRATSLFRRLKPYMGLISLVSGLLLIGIGLLMLTDNFKLLPRYFYWGAL